MTTDVATMPLERQDTVVPEIKKPDAAELATMSYEERRRSMWSCLYTLHEVLPGLLAMFFIAIFANNLAGVPNPFTLENLFHYLDNVIGPVNGQPFFQILNANFVWNSALLGLIIGNVFGVPDSWKRGLSYIHKFMPLGIIMLAPHFIVSHAAKVGFWPIFITAGFLLLTSSLTLAAGRFFRVDDRHSSCIAGGLATGDPHVCAILMPMIKAKGGQVLNAFVSIVLFGALATMVMPWLAGLMGVEDKLFGLATVIGIGNGAQAHSAAFALSYEAGRYSAYLDVARHVIMPAGFIYVFAVMFIRKLVKKNDPAVNATKGVNSIPVYLIVFMVSWAVACMHVFKEPAHHAIFSMVKWDFSLAAAALGLCMSFKEIWQWGTWRGFALTCFAGTVRILLVLGVVVLCAKFQLFEIM